MKLEVLRDTLAIEITRILLTKSDATDFSDVGKILSCAYPLADSVLSRRNVSRPLITRHD
jgi:hypothetical protein